MMQNDLMQPQTRAALRALAARRRRVLLARGLFAFVLTLLAAMAGVATIDRVAVLGQEMRIVLSLLAYVGVMATVYLVSLRYLLRWPSAAELARLIEKAEPGLREDLVSAVELADHSSGYDSEAFREVLQRNVGKRVASVDPQRVLPWKLIAWWAAVSTGAVVITIALLLTPGLRYGEMLTRAMLPTADLDRVSSVQITLLDPSPDSSGRVPMNERVPIRVQVTGGRFDKVQLEVDRGREGKESLRFAPTRAADEFAIDLPVADQPLRFRVSAGDGLTRYFDITPTARPRITRAARTTTPPRYTGFEPTRQSGDLGPITALAGSVVDLVLTADQPIAKAELRLDVAGEETAIPLRVDPADPTRLRGSVSIQRSGDYRVFLVAKESGFNTPDAQRHELIALADELPTVTLDQPSGASGSARDALVRVRGSATDDVALRRIEREIRVNGGAWQGTEMTATDRGHIAEAMDLMDLNLSVGDEVELRLSATDMADNTAYSQSARLIVTPDGLRQIDAQALASQDALLAALVQADAAARVLREALEQAANSDDARPVVRQQQLARLRSLQTSLDDQRTLVAQRTEAALDIAQPGREADHLVRIGRLADPPAAMDLSAISLDDREQVHALARLAGEDERAFRQARDLLHGNLLLAHAQTVKLQLATLRDELMRGLNDLRIDDPIDPQLADQRLFRRTLGMVAQAREAQRGLDTLAQLGDGTGLRGMAEQSARPLGKAIATLTPALRDQPGREELLTLLNTFDQALTQSYTEAFNLTTQARRDAYQLYERHTDEVRAGYARLVDLPRQPSDAGASARWGRAVDHLAYYADIEELSPDADRAFVQDTGQVLVGLDEYRKAAETGESAEVLNAKFSALMDAYGTLERVHELRTLHAMVVALGQSEEARGDDPAAALRRRGDWQAIDFRFEDVRATLDQVQSLRPAAQIVNNLRGQTPYRSVNNEMGRRDDIGHEAVTRQGELDEIARRLAEAIDTAKPAVDQARQTLSEMNPSLPERMRELARRADDLSDQTEQAAQRAQQDPSAQAQQDAAQLAQQQDQLNNQLDRLSDEIRRQADQEDLLTQESRDRSRDADDAIAMLKPDAQEATRQLDEAQTLERADLQAKAIQQASDAQERSAETLRQLAEHYENQANDPAAAEESRQALRDAEQELGIDEELDEQYERMRRLAELAQVDDEQRLAQLEEMLEQDPAMQRELDRLAEQMAEDAQQQVADAAAQEHRLADRLEDRGEEAQQQAQRQQQALERLAERAAELERDRVRPLEDAAGRDVPQARDEVQEAREELREAAQQAAPNQAAQQEQGQPAEQQQRIEEFAQSTREASEAVNETTQQAEQLRNNATQQAQEARQRADRANREGQPDAQAANEIVESRRQAENAEQVRRSAETAGREVEQLANQAEQLANQAAREGEQRERDLGQGAQQQERLAQQTAQSAENLERAARHQERLGDQQRAEQLQQQADQVGDLAEQTLPQAGQQLANAQSHEQGEQAARQAAEQLQQQAQRMNGQNEQAPGQQGESQQGQPQQGDPQQGQPQQGEPQQGSPNSPNSPNAPQSGQPGQQGESAQPGQPNEQSSNGQPNEGGQMTPEMAEQLARELDRLDKQLAQEGQSSDTPPGTRPIDQAAQQQAQNIREARNPSSQQGQPGQQPNPNMAMPPGEPNGPGSPENNGAGPAPAGDIAKLGEKPGGDGDWGDLPPRMVEDLSQGARERAPSEYLDQVDAYFKAIAQRARQDASGQGGGE